ncbi:MAG: hypothetical protein ABSH14_05275 [Verrucomicrobiia bacterium]
MITIEIDATRNLLAMKYGGRVEAGEMRRHLGEVRAAVGSMPPGFRMLVDLTNLESMTTTCAPYIDQVMDLCNEKGVTKVVRVVPDSKKDIGLGIMSHFHYNRDVHIITCETADEATRALGG